MPLRSRWKKYISWRETDLRIRVADHSNFRPSYMSEHGDRWWVGRNRNTCKWPQSRWSVRPSTTGRHEYWQVLDIESLPTRTIIFTYWSHMTINSIFKMQLCTYARIYTCMRTDTHDKHLHQYILLVRICYVALVHLNVCIIPSCCQGWIRCSNCLPTTVATWLNTFQRNIVIDCKCL